MLRFVCIIALFGQLACNGLIGDAVGGPGGTQGEDHGGPGGTPRAPTAGLAPLRRLTRAEYEATARDLLGLASTPTTTLPGDEHGPSGFTEPSVITITEMNALLQVGETLTAGLNLSPLLACATKDDACATKFIATFGRKAYRRPLDDEDRAALRAVYDSGRGALGMGFDDAIRLVIRAALVSPRFVYHWGALEPEVDAATGLVKLDAWETAAKLSYYLVGSSPDGELSALADSGALADPTTVAGQARRLLADPRARTHLRSFVRQWLTLDKVASSQKDTTVFPTFTPALRDAISEESDAFIDYVLFDSDHRLPTLFEDRTAFLDDAMAELYDVPAGTAQLPLSRPGIFTRAAFLTTAALTHDTSPTQRGEVIRRRILCQDVPPPPPEAGSNVGTGDAKTTRELYLRHASDPMCASCHSLMDPLGFAFESFDAIGTFRTTDDGLPLDTTGEVVGIEEGPVAFADAPELVGMLADLPEAQRCVPTQLVRWLLGRPDGRADESSIDDATAAFVASGLDLHAVVVAVTQTRAFRFRERSEGEVVR